MDEVLDNEQGSLGLIDSENHVIIISGSKEIQFTRGMADLRESDELISMIEEILFVNFVPEYDEDDFDLFSHYNNDEDGFDSCENDDEDED